MKKTNQKNKSETHPLFPSGQWEGFYIYSFGPDAAQHKMDVSLNFQNNFIKGGGSDDVGAFSWEGNYDKENLSCRMIKKYATHSVTYQGHVDENGIWGSWMMPFMKGGFHIWPKKDQEKNKKQEKKKKSNRITIADIKKQIENLPGKKP